jgi:catechol-2,3-dioxygenase
MQNYGYRAPTDLRLGAVTIKVRDRGRMLAFYQETLGLEVLEEDQDQISLGFQQTGHWSSLMSRHPPRKGRPE